jgi:AMMECR1 domain-containing protein
VLGFFRRHSFDVPDKQRKVLLDAAEETLHRRRGAERWGPVPPPRGLPALERRAAVFVSLHHNGRLIGCAGCRQRLLPLAETVPRTTLAAALHDPRRLWTEAIREDVETEMSFIA